MTKRLFKFDEINTLSLLAHKVAPNVFDLSSNQINVSIRDQMVRAQQLISDLRAADVKAQSILIVGMGAAGMTAALAACEAEFTTVCAVDVAAEPFALFNGIRSRFVGPYMYEWPSPFCNDQSYPGHGATPWAGQKISPLSWTASRPITAHKLAQNLRKSVLTWHADNQRKPKPVPTPHLLVGIDKKKLRDFVKKFAKVEGVRGKRQAGEPVPEKVRLGRYLGTHAQWTGIPNESLPTAFAPDYVVLAAGMGVEVLHIPGACGKQMAPGFWENDKLKRRKVADQHTVVLGGGDGAIQDSLRALTNYHHPLAFIEHLDALPSARQALAIQLPALLSADRQLRQHTSWSRSTSGFIMVDKACHDAALQLAAVPAVRQFVLSTLRRGNGTVTHYVRSQHFDKAYLLNRFVIYLLAACVDPDPGRNTGGMGFSLQFGFEVKHVRTVPKSAAVAIKWNLGLGPPGRLRTPVTARKKNVDNVVVRFGIDPFSVPGPTLIQFDEDYAEHRTTLNRVELPFVTMNR
jgi:hypothetical protein